MKKNVLVFGGAGFIGSYLSEELVARGYKVTVADVKKNKYLSGVDFIECDINSVEQIANALSDNVDFVYNFAGFANLDKAIDSPVNTIKLNVMGNLNILEEVRKYPNIQRYVFASSAYAMSDKGSFYGISKLASEKLIEEYNKKYNLRYSILRYGSVYSERYFDNNYIYSLVQEIIQNKKVFHNGDGNEIREYIHAADTAKMAVDVIEKDEFENQHLILTGVERMKRIELFQMIEEILGEKIEIKLSNVENSNHYKFTPYAFHPTMSKKVIADSYIDMGQGLLECIKNVYENEK